VREAVAAGVRGIDGLRPQVQRGLRNERDGNRWERSAHGTRAAHVRADDHDRDKGEDHQMRETAVAERVGEGRGGDARGRRGGQERVPKSHGRPSRLVYRESACGAL
jgi:hypothetical protein